MTTRPASASEQIQLENEIKKLSFYLREKEMDTQARERAGARQFV